MAEVDDLEALNYRQLQALARTLHLPARKPEQILRDAIRKARGLDRLTQTADAVHVAAQPLRREILSLVSRGVATNAALADRLGTRQQNINFHARALVDAGLLEEQVSDGPGRVQVPKAYALTSKGRALMADLGRAADAGASREQLYTFRADAALIDTLRAAGLSPEAIAKEAIEREARKVNKLAALRRLDEEARGYRLGFDAVDFIRRDRDTHV